MRKRRGRSLSHWSIVSADHFLSIKMHIASTESFLVLTRWCDSDDTGKGKVTLRPGRKEKICSSFYVIRLMWVFWRWFLSTIWDWTVHMYRAVTRPPTCAATTVILWCPGQLQKLWNHCPFFTVTAQGLLFLLTTNTNYIVNWLALCLSAIRSG